MQQNYLVQVDAQEQSEPDIYQAYMRDVDKVSRVPNDVQTDWHNMCRKQAVVSACEHLAQQAVLIVAYVVGKMRRSGALPTVFSDDLDAIQEGNIAALEALPRWDPDRGTLGTWLVPQIRGRLLNYANTHLNAGIGSKHTRVIRTGLDESVAFEEVAEAQDEPGAEQSVPISLEESLVYDRNVLPDQYTTALATHAYQAMARLWPSDRILLQLIYVDGLTVAEVARVRGMQHETIRRQLRAAEENLRVEIARQTGI